MDKIAQLTDESTNPFGDDIIYAYTWDDAVADGTFVEVTETAMQRGFKIPVALTTSVFALCEADDDQMTSHNIVRLLLKLQMEIRKQTEDSSRIEFKHTFDVHYATEVWATIEGRNPSNPEPVMTIMLVEDY